MWSPRSWFRECISRQRTSLGSAWETFFTKWKTTWVRNCDWEHLRVIRKWDFSRTKSLRKPRSRHLDLRLTLLNTRITSSSRTKRATTTLTEVVKVCMIRVTRDKLTHIKFYYNLEYNQKLNNDPMLSLILSFYVFWTICYTFIWRMYSSICSVFWGIWLGVGICWEGGYLISWMRACMCRSLLTFVNPKSVCMPPLS